MKAKRRQELKTNDLAQWLEDMSVSFKDWGVYILAGVAVVVIGLVIVAYRQSAKAEALARDYTDLRSASSLSVRPGERKTTEEVAESLAKIGILAVDARSDTLRLDALVEKGNLALQLAEGGAAGIDKKYLEDARSAFQQIADEYPDRAIYFGRALFGLFHVEADLFAIDGDVAHQSRAAAYLEKLRDDGRLAGTPYQTMAIELLTELDEIFTPVTFPPRPAPTPTPVAAAPAASSPDEPAPTPSGEEVIPKEEVIPEPPALTTNGAQPPDDAEPAATADDSADAPAEDSGPQVP